MKFASRISRQSARVVAVLLLALPFSGAQTARTQKPALSKEVKAALDRVSAESLKGHLSFIASDLLEGRNTPSPGLDIAASYIAAQFRRAGLEPVGDDGYYQTANWLLMERDVKAFNLVFEDSGKATSVGIDRVSLPNSVSATVSGASLFKVDYKDAALLAVLQPSDIEGKAVITDIPDFQSETGARRSEIFRTMGEFVNKISGLKPALVLSVNRSNPTGTGAGAGRLIDPENRPAAPPASRMGIVSVHDPEVVRLYDSLKPGLSTATVSARLGGFVEKGVKLRNVVGLLRGSDPVLKDTYVLLTAHYDHIGVRPFGEGDRINNGANDDGSGTVSLIEIASALSRLNPRPRRSILFMAFFGEEKGLLGSRYYGRHPVFPIEKTVADVNLEQVGRTDDSEGPQVGTAALTGFDYSDVGTIFKTAGEMVGVRVYKHERNSDAFFSRSDNQALADQGVPAHTLSVSYNFPDYHGVGDHWEKIDYVNMEKINRLIALGLLMIANNKEEPKWNEANPSAARYLKAWRDRRAQ
ncbi:MAG TPA: M28 family peptidase [Blastocatellia bacterium]|nr:M28 family peptidase [Blastocatellia bacterium]